MLNLNNDKTECIVSMSKCNTNLFAGANVHVGRTTVENSSKIRNLGVTFNQTMSMQTYVCFYYFEKHC